MDSNAVVCCFFVAPISSPQKYDFDSFLNNFSRIYCGEPSQADELKLIKSMCTRPEQTMGAHFFLTNFKLGKTMVLKETLDIPQITSSDNFQAEYGIQLFKDKFGANLDIEQGAYYIMSKEHHFIQLQFKGYADPTDNAE